MASGRTVRVHHPGTTPPGTTERAPPRKATNPWRDALRRVRLLGRPGMRVRRLITKFGFSPSSCGYAVGWPWCHLARCATPRANPAGTTERAPPRKATNPWRDALRRVRLPARQGILPPEADQEIRVQTFILWLLGDRWRALPRDNPRGHDRACPSKESNESLEGRPPSRPSSSCQDPGTALSAK